MNSSILNCIAGAGGESSAQTAQSSREYPDTLQSKEMVSFLELIGEGSIGGIVGGTENGAKSIFFNDTPIQADDGSYNFTVSSWDHREGTQNQTPISGFADIETPYAESVRVKKDQPHVISVTNPQVDSVRIIMSVPGLARTDLSTGDTVGTSVQYQFLMSKNGGSYYPIVSGVIWEKTGTISGYEVTKGSGTNGVRFEVDLNVVSTNPILTGLIAYCNYLSKSPYDGYFYNGRFSVISTATFQPQGWDGAGWVDIGERQSITKTEKYPDPAMKYGNLSKTLSKVVIVGNGFEKVRLNSITTSSKVSITDPIDGNLFLYYDMDFETPIDGAHYAALTDDESAGTCSVVISNVESNTDTPVITLSGKSRSRYQRSHLITLPKPATHWDIKIQRLTDDSVTSAEVNETWVSSYVEITNTKLNYPNSALMSLRVDSSQFNSIPTRSYLVDGLYIRVPENYDPVTRVYSGDWNGNMKIAVSNNPAWVLFDLLTQARYGLGRFITDGQVDKYTLYTIGKYCDVMVDSGSKTELGATIYEPRFTLNTAIQQESDSYKLIADICSVFQGMGFWNGDRVSFTQDSVSDPVMIYSQANVVDGVFNYSSSGRRDRNSVVLVTWNDPAERYKQKIEYVESETLYRRYGYRKTDMVAFGCTSRGQAHRAGKWLLMTEEHESNAITFKVGIDSALVVPGEIIKINDAFRAGVRMGGRLVDCTTTSATLDATTEINQLGAIITVRLPDGTITDRTILQTPGTHSIVTWANPLPELPVANAMWVIAESSLQSQLARVVSIGQDSTTPDTYIITAIDHNPNKRAAIESDIVLEDAPISAYSLVSIPANLKVTTEIYGTTAEKKIKTTISWEGKAKEYEVSVRQINEVIGNWTNVTTSEQMIEIPDCPIGDWELSVCSKNSYGKYSKPAIATFTTTLAGDSNWLATPIDPMIYCSPDADGVVTKARVTLKFAPGAHSPVDGLALMLSVTQKQNKVGVNSGGTTDTLNIGSGVEVIASGVGTILSGSDVNKLVIRDILHPMDTSYNECGRWWVKLSTGTKWYRVSKIDEFSLLFDSPFDQVPIIGDTFEYAELAWWDERTGEAKLAVITDASGNREVFRWRNIVNDAAGFKVTQCERGLEGTKVINADGLDMFYYPAPGPGTQLVTFPASAFSLDAVTGTFSGSSDVDFKVPAGFFVTATVAIYATVAGKLARSNIVPITYGGPL